MYKKGTVVLVPFPFTDLSGTKVRPAVIISKKLIRDDLNVIFLSSKKRKPLQTDVPVFADLLNGLKVDSIANIHKIATLDKKVILGEIGVVSSPIQTKIDKSLKSILGL